MATTTQTQTEIQTHLQAPGHMPRQGSRLWKHHDFMLFWAGESVSFFGSQITLLALPLTAVVTLHATAAQLGFVRGIQMLPYVLFTLIFGAWVDRRQRKPILMLANVARGVLIGLVPLLAVLNILHLSLLALIAFAVGVFTVLFDVTWQAYVPSIVTKEQLIEANGKLGTSSTVAEMAGPGIGGLLIQVLTAPLAMLFDALSYVIATITLVAIRTPEPIPQSRPGRPRLFGDIAEGLAMVWHNASLRWLMLMGGLWRMLFGIADTVFVFYAVRELQLQASVLGAIFAVGAIGGIIGTAISTRGGKRGRLGRMILVAFTFGSVPWVLIPAVSGPLPLQIGVFMLAYFCIRMGLGLWFVAVYSFRQAVTPNHLMGRVAATSRFVAYGLNSVGLLLSGVLASLLGLRPTLWLAAGAYLAILLILVLFTPLTHIRVTPSASSAEDASTLAR